MRAVAGFALVALVLNACGDTGGETAPVPTATSAPQTTTTTAPVPATAPGTTTTTTATTQPPPTEVTPPENATAVFSLTQVAFGDAAFVQITNTGNGPGDLGGHWLCQRPVYFEIPDVELGPGESVWIAADGGDLQFVGTVVGVLDAEGRLGSLAPASGEVALYRSNDFSSIDAIVDYVEWGTAGHGRSSVAAGAGIWPEGGFVETTADTIAITSMGGDGPESWAPDIGV